MTEPTQAEPDLFRPETDLPLDSRGSSALDRDEPLDPSIHPAEPGALGPSRGTGPWPLVAMIVVLAAAAGTWWWWQGRSPRGAETKAPAAPAADTALAPAARPLGGNPFPADVPSLDLSDAFVRTWVPKLSSHPRVAAWLTTDGLVRNFVTVVANIAEGPSPAGRVPVLKPRGSFQVVERNGRLYVDPRSYERYNELAAGFASLDSAAAAQLYATLKPRIEEASGELGGRGSFDATLERAITSLLKTPIRDQPLAVEPAGIGYRYVDADLDSLSGAQKHLLRMGPANARLVQRQLRDVAIALGIPAARLP